MGWALLIIHILCIIQPVCAFVIILLSALITAAQLAMKKQQYY